MSLNRVMQNFEENFFLYLLIIFLFCFRFETLFMPIYWDEAIYFTPSIFKNGLLDFLPHNYNPEHYHGHPPLFQLLLLASSKLFGQNPLAAHIVSFVSLIYFIFITNKFLSRYFNKKLAISTLIIFLTYPYVFIQSLLFVPNYLMIAFALHSFIFFLEKDYTKYAVFSVLAVLTRESALSFFLFPLIILFFDLTKKKIKLFDLLKGIIPFVTIISFFIFNKLISQRGTFINHPYVLSRIRRNEFEFQNIIDSIYWSYKALDESTSNSFGSLVFILILCIFYIFYKKDLKKKIHFKLSRALVLYTTATLGFLAFFLFYGDTIQRDFTYVSLVYTSLLAIPMTMVLKTEIIIIIVALHSLLQIERHFEKDITDLSYASFYQRVIIYQEIADKVNEHYSDIKWIKCTWPCLTLFEEPRYGYLDKKYYTTTFDEKAELFISSEINAPNTHKTNFNKYEVDLEYEVQDIPFSPTKFYLKKELIEKDTNE